MLRGQIFLKIHVARVKKCQRTSGASVSLQQVPETCPGDVFTNVQTLRFHFHPLISTKDESCRTRSSYSTPQQKQQQKHIFCWDDADNSSTMKQVAVTFFNQLSIYFGKIS